MYILRAAFANFQRRYPKTDLYEQLKDAHGVYAYRIMSKESGRHAFFAAKGSQDGDMISIHLTMFEEARRKNLPIFIALGAERFYRYMPADILREKPYVNERNDALYLNFPIRAGQSLQSGKQKSGERNTESNRHKVERMLIDELQAERVAEECGPSS
jgi:hypothetical protein